MTRSTTTRPPDVSSAAPLREPDPFEIFASLFTRTIGRIFNMTYRAGRIRQVVLAACSVLTWTVLALLAHPIPEWQSLILAIFNPALQPDVANPLVTLLRRILGAYLGLDVIGHLIALILPMVLALQVAATFLDDVYELKGDRNCAPLYHPRRLLSGQGLASCTFKTAMSLKLKRKTPCF